MIAEIRSPTASRQGFQQLKTQLHCQMVDSIDVSKAGQLEADELRQQLRALAGHLCSLEPVALPVGEREAMVQEIMDEIFAFGPLQPLMNDPDVNYVLGNGWQNVYIERDGRLQPTDVKF